MTTGEKRPPGLPERTRREALRLKISQAAGISGRVAQAFSIEADAAARRRLLLLGAFAVMVTPREEEPQIKVPMVDVFVQMPGATASEVEQRLVTPLEKALFEIPGAEYVYSTTQPSGGMIIVRYEVGTDPDTAALRVHAKLGELAASLPEGVPPPLVVPRGIDDVPVLAYTLWSEQATPLQLRQVAQELRFELARHPRVAQVTVLGGERRVVSVRFDRERLAAHHVSILQVYQALAGLNWKLPAGAFATGNLETEVQAPLPLRHRGRQRVPGRRRPVYCVTSPSRRRRQPSQYVG